MGPESEENLRLPTDRDSGSRTALGVLIGGALFLLTMLFAALGAILSGMFHSDASGRLNLAPWLILEILAGTIACLMSGVVCRRIAISYRGPLILAASLFTLSMLETAEILRHVSANRVVAPFWLAISAPFASAVSVLIGGMIPQTQLGRIRIGVRQFRLGESLRIGVPVVVFVTAVFLAVFALPEVALGAPAMVVASALTLDLTVVVPGLVFLLLVRSRRAPWLVLVPAFVVGYAIAVALVPGSHPGLMYLIGMLILPAELCLVAYLVLVTRRALLTAIGRIGDFATRLRATARDVLGNRIAADILTTEISILYYAFAKRGRFAGNAENFTVHRRVGYQAVLIGLGMVLFVETVALHLFLSQWSTFAAWTLTGLSIYAMVWLVGDYRAMNARPIRLTSSHLLLRVGLRWEVDIPLDQIERVEPVTASHESPDRAILVAALLGQPNLRLLLKVPVPIIGMYGICRSAREIWLTVDDHRRLIEELEVSGYLRNPVP